MKKILILCFLGCMLSAAAAGPRYHRPPRHRSPHQSSIVHKIPWKTIVAGGAATGIVITSYKLSDGVETGLETAAQKRPDLFLQQINPWSLSLKLLLGGGIVAVLYYLIKIKKGIPHGTSQK